MEVSVTYFETTNRVETVKVTRDLNTTTYRRWGNLNPKYFSKAIGDREELSHPERREEYETLPEIVKKIFAADTPKTVEALLAECTNRDNPLVRF